MERGGDDREDKDNLLDSLHHLLSCKRMVRTAQAIISKFERYHQLGYRQDGHTLTLKKKENLNQTIQIITLKFNEIMYKVTDVNTYHYPHVVLEILNTTTGETKYWHYTALHYEEHCRQLEVNTLEDCTLSDLPRNGGWLDEKDLMYYL